MRQHHGSADAAHRNDWQQRRRLDAISGSVWPSDLLANAANPIYAPRCTRAFTKRLLAASKDANHPNQGHASTYSSVHHYMRTVAAAGGAEAKRSGRAIIAKMKLLPTQDDAFGPGRVRTDGRGEFPAHLFHVKTPAESKGLWDVYKLIRTSTVEEVLHPVNPKCSFSIG